MTIYNAPTMGTYGSTWQASGYSGGGNVGELIGSLRGRPAVVCGNAVGVFHELEYVKTKIEGPVIFAVNDVGMYLPHVDHWASLHSDNLSAWKSVRWLHHHGVEDTKYHSYEQKDAVVNYVWDKLTPLFALSGYFAMQIAHIMGAGLIVLCGCPGHRQRRFFEAQPREEFGYGEGADMGVREQLIKECARVPEMKEKVRSQSGWTGEFFGGL